LETDIDDYHSLNTHEKGGKKGKKKKTGEKKG
jgi:hypothetical protein